MAKEYSNTEWIEQYVRGELHGEDLQKFEKKLTNDLELKEEFDLHFILAKAIQEARKNELKEYLSLGLKAKKRSLFEYNWVYSAAAAVVLLVASVSVYFIIKKPSSSISLQNDVVKHEFKNYNEPQFSSSDKNKIKGNNQTNVLPVPNSYIDSTSIVVLNDAPVNGDGVMESETLGTGTKDINFLEREQAQMVYTVWMAVGQESKQTSDEEDTKTRVISTAKSVEKNENNQKRAKGKTTSAQNETAPTTPNKGLEMDTISLNKINVESFVTSLQVSYFETKSGEPKYSFNSKELKLYNIPYNNPRIYYRNNALVLENGEKTYDVNAKGIGLDLNVIAP